MGLMLSGSSGASGAPTGDHDQATLADAPSEEAASLETRKRLDKVKKIRVPEKQLDYLAKIITGIEKGEANSHWQLGIAYLHGTLVTWDQFPKDKRSALFWFRRSAELGLAYSQYHLGVMYLGDIAWELRMEYSPDDLIEKNPDEAVKWLSKAADQSDTFAVFAQDVLGEMYFSGIVVKPDHTKAFALFSKVAANPQNLMARFGLATRATERLPTLKTQGHG